MVRVYSLTRLLLQCTETYTSLKFQVIWAENGTTVLKGTPIYLYTAKKKKKHSVPKYNDRLYSILMYKRSL